MKKASQLLILGAGILWVLFIVLDYWQKHSLLAKVLTEFAYYDLMVLLLLICAVLAYLIDKDHFGVRRYINGLSVFALMLVLLLVSLSFYNQRILIPNGVTDIRLGKVAAYFSLIFTMTFSVIALSFVIGDWLLGQFAGLGNQRSHTVVSIAGGIVIWTLFLFVLGIANLLYWYTLLPACLLVFILSGRRLLTFLKVCCWKPWTLPKKGVYLTVFSFFLIAFFVFINATHLLSPIPKGFDSMNYYMNISRLLYEQHGLVYPFQPYAWSLFMSTGLFLFGKLEVAMWLSMTGGLLALCALFVLGSYYLRIRKDMLLFSLALLYSLPSFVMQSSAEIKVDLGLLFIQITSVIVCIDWMHAKRKSPKSALDTKAAGKAWKSTHIWVVGILCGFSLSIKLTSILFLASIAGFLYYTLCGKRSFIGAALLLFGLILILQLDSISSLRAYHRYTGIWQWVFIIGGMILLALDWVKDRIKYNRLAVHLATFLVIALLTFSPWIVKSLSQANEFSIHAIYSSGQPGPEISFPIMKRNFENMGGADHE